MVLLLISSRYGRFPMFWQDLKEWENWNEVKKIYMKEKEKQELKAIVEENEKTDGEKQRNV